MNSLLRHFLLLVVALGLAGQGVAFASNPCGMMAQTHVAHASAAKAMPDMPGCTMSATEMKVVKADMNKAGKGSTPCKGMGLCCLSMAGGGAIAALDTAQEMRRLPVSAATALPRPADSFPLGWNILPELDPPSHLG